MYYNGWSLSNMSNGCQVGWKIHVTYLRFLGCDLIHGRLVMQVGYRETAITLHQYPLLWDIAFTCAQGVVQSHPTKDDIGHRGAILSGTPLPWYMK